MSKKANHLAVLDLGGIVTLLALSAMFYFLALWPLLDRQSVRQAQNAQLAAKRQQAAQMNSQLASTRARVVAARELAGKSAIQLQTTQQLNQRTSEMMKVADACGLQVHEIHPRPAISRDRFDVIPIQLAGMGSYGACARFMHDIHETFPDTGINAFDLEGNSQAAGQPANFRFTIWWHTAPSMTADVPLPAGK